MSVGSQKEYSLGQQPHTQDLSIFRREGHGSDVTDRLLDGPWLNEHTVHTHTHHMESL